MDFHFQNTSNDHSISNSSHKIKTGYTVDKWTFEEVKIYESAMVNFEDTSSLAFFEHVAGLMPWKTIESIKNHGQNLMKDMSLIKSSNGKFEDIVDEEDIDAHNETKKVTPRPMKKGIPWTVEEHKLFLKGLEEMGKGEWKSISKKYLPNKTSAQIASHAQKFYRRMHTKTPLEKRRASINDITLYSEPEFPLNSEVLQSHQLDPLLNSNYFLPNEATFSFESQGFETNRIDFLSNSPTFQSDQVISPLNSERFQPNQINIPINFQNSYPNELNLPLNSQNFETNQLDNVTPGSYM